MINKKPLKILIDFCMTILLLFLMAFQVTGDEYHEWIGAGMLVLFLLHNALNYKWYKGIFKGKYSVLRVLRTIINIAVLGMILITGYSGIVMSRYVFSFLPISGGMATARNLHMIGSFWGFVLMSIHLGMHWGMVTNAISKRTKDNTSNGVNILWWVLRVVAFAIAVYGAYVFGRDQIYSYMFLQSHFVMFDYEKAAVLVLLENIAMMGTWVFVGHYVTRGLATMASKQRQYRKEALCMIVSLAVFVCTILMGPSAPTSTSWESESAETEQVETTQEETTQEVETEPTEAPEATPAADASAATTANVEDGFVLIQGGTFQMGSPESENWRSADETQHEVTVSEFYMSPYEVTQAEYEQVVGENPSSFSGETLPVESVSWLDAIQYCNLRSEQAGLTPAYQIDGTNVTWNRAANGYRLPTEAEWEYACRAGTTTPFNTETSISPDESNYYGHYPYEIEGNYFEQENLTTKPGQYRQTTVEVNSFSPNGWGLYNMHGNVSEWVWDYYGAYDTAASTDPTGAASGNLRVYRGGGWNDFAKNMRSAYRATLEEDLGSFNIGIRLVRNATTTNTDVVGGTNTSQRTQAGQAGKVLIAYFSWGGNTRGIAEEIQAQTGADLFEITLVDPYSENYNTVLDESQHDQNIQARPEIEGHVDNMDEYDTIILGYPNWWASIPMPIASFLEEYDFSGKTIIPFCSHGGGRFGQSLTAIAKLAPNSVMGEGLSVHYSGGSTLESDVSQWLRDNGVIQ